MPLCETQESPVIVMQYVLYTKRVMEDVRITAEGPSGWRFREKAAGMWDDSQEVADIQLQADLGTCQPWKRHVIPFWVKLNQTEHTEHPHPPVSTEPEDAAGTIPPCILHPDLI